MSGVVYNLREVQFEFISLSLFLPTSLTHDLYTLQEQQNIRAVYRKISKSLSARLPLTSQTTLRLAGVETPEILGAASLYEWYEQTYVLVSAQRLVALSHHLPLYHII